MDFVAEKDGQVLYVQVTYLLATTDWEFSVLEDIRDHYPKLVLSRPFQYLPDWL